MDNYKPLIKTDAARKIKEMIGNGNMVMFCCNLNHQPFAATPMSTQGVDDDGTVWFFSTRDSSRNEFVAKDSRVQLIYGNSGVSDYLSIYGEAHIVEDKVKTKELWNTFAKVWFQEGPEDPNLSLIRFVPSDGFYWDTKHGKMIAFAKMLASIATGKTMDDSVDGTLKL